MTSNRRDTIDAINEAYRVVCTAYSKLRAERDAALAELADAKAVIERLREALKKIYTYRSNEPDWNMVMAIAGDIVEPMEVVPSAALDAKVEGKNMMENEQVFPT